MSYKETYLKRLNRYGTDYQSRIQGNREKDFQNYLLKSVYSTSIKYEEEEHRVIFKPHKQDDTEVFQHLLTPRNLNIPQGTVLELKDHMGVSQQWLVYWHEKIQASGYNRYTMLRMTHNISWKDRSGIVRTSWAYFHGIQSSIIREKLMRYSNNKPMYFELDKESFFIIPLNIYLKRNDYFTIGEGELKEAYRVGGYDIQSTEGIEFVTAVPVFERDETQIEISDSEAQTDDYYWLLQNDKPTENKENEEDEPVEEEGEEELP